MSLRNLCEWILPLDHDGSSHRNVARSNSEIAFL